MFYSFPFDVTQHHQGWSFWKDGFTEGELLSIIVLGEKLDFVKSSVNTEDAEVLDVKNYGLDLPTAAETEWFYDRLCRITRDMNNNWFGFDISGVSSFKFVKRDALTPPEMCAWHTDRQGRPTEDSRFIPRKLSIELLLIDPSEYEGGEHQINGLACEDLPVSKGQVMAYPAYALHRVTPVTAGVRKSLVAYFTGPDFK